MLQDKDRVFNNIYGIHDRSLKGAMARGHRDGTKAIFEKGRALRDEWVKQCKRLAKGWRPDNAVGDKPMKG